MVKGYVLQRCLFSSNLTFQFRPHSHTPLHLRWAYAYDVLKMLCKQRKEGGRWWRVLRVVEHLGEVLFLRFNLKWWLLPTGVEVLNMGAKMCIIKIRKDRSKLVLCALVCKEIGASILLKAQRLLIPTPPIQGSSAYFSHIKGITEFGGYDVITL